MWSPFVRYRAKADLYTLFTLYVLNFSLPPSLSFSLFLSLLLLSILYIFRFSPSAFLFAILVFFLLFLFLFLAISFSFSFSLSLSFPSSCVIFPCLTLWLSVSLSFFFSVKSWASSFLLFPTLSPCLRLSFWSLFLSPFYSLSFSFNFHLCLIFIFFFSRFLSVFFHLHIHFSFLIFSTTLIFFDGLSFLAKRWERETKGNVYLSIYLFFYVEIVIDCFSE